MTHTDLLFTALILSILLIALVVIKKLCKINLEENGFLLFIIGLVSIGLYSTLLIIFG
jgi:hypothetical protein